MMDTRDFHDDKNHEQKTVSPKLQKDTDRLEAMHTLFHESMIEALQRTSIEPILGGGKAQSQQIAPGVTMVSIEHGKFQGLVICAECCRRAAMFYRDAAKCLEDIIQETENAE